MRCLWYLAVQYARVPAQLDQAVELQRQMIECVALGIPEVRDELLSGRFRITMRKSARFEVLGLVIKAAFRCLSLMDWEVLEAPDGSEFVTSDNPVVGIGPVPPPQTPGLGMRSTRLIFPLSPTISLRLRHQAGDTLVVPLNEDADAQVPSVVRRTCLTAAQVAIQNKYLGSYATSFVVARSREPLIRLRRDLANLYEPA